MDKKKYLVRVIRPVFQSAVIEVEAATEMEAVNTARIDAYQIPAGEWRGRFDDENYFFDGHLIESGGSEEGYQYCSIANFPKYCLLQADMDRELGNFVMQPWVGDLSPLLLASVCSDWNQQLRKVRNEGLDEAFEPAADLLEQLKEEKISPSPEGRQKDIENLTAILDGLEKIKGES